MGRHDNLSDVLICETECTTQKHIQSLKGFDMGGNLFMILTVICIALLVQETRKCHTKIYQSDIKIMEVETRLTRVNTKAYEKLHEILDLMERMNNNTAKILLLFDRLKNKVGELKKHDKKINDCLNQS